MAEVQRFNLVQKLEEADEKLMGSPSLLGMTMLTYPAYINAMRGTMFTAHVKQYLNLKEGLFPKVFTNTENLVGKHSNGYKKAKHNLKIIDKVIKFEGIVDDPQIYKLFVYDETTKTYDVIERKPCESLAENFGFDIVNDVIDSYNKGDTIPKDQVYMKSTSYDDDMNFSYGRNVTVAYTLDPFTSEDAAVASESFCKDFTSIETDDITINLNGNDYMLNLYGDKEHYKVFPDIGESTSDILCASRRQFNNQLLYDFKESSLREIHEGDNVYYIDKDEEVVDITIYNNIEDLKETSFNKQILKYLKGQTKYYRRIRDICEEIIIKCDNSGGAVKYSNELDYLYSRAKLFLDSKKKWVDQDMFSGDMQVIITVKRDAPITKGCKVTGRYGNKSVIAKICKDEDMPYTKDGRRVDLLLNMLAVINRTTAQVLIELFVNGCAYQVQQHMKTLSTYEEKETMLFDFLNIFNEEQCRHFYKDYSKKSAKAKKEYIDSAINDGIFVHLDNLAETTPVFYRCIHALEKFPFIKEDDLYIRKWGREYKCLTKSFIGEMYILKNLRIQNPFNCWKAISQSAA